MESAYFRIFKQTISQIYLLQIKIHNILLNKQLITLIFFIITNLKAYLQILLKMAIKILQFSTNKRFKTQGTNNKKIVPNYKENNKLRTTLQKVPSNTNINKLAQLFFQLNVLNSKKTMEI